MQFLADSLPTTRGLALFAFQNRPRGTSAPLEATKIANALHLDDETAEDDFHIGQQIRTKALERVLDPSGLKLLADLCKAWKAPEEHVMHEALRVFSRIKPDSSTFNTDLDL